MGTGLEWVGLLVLAPAHMRDRELRELGPEACQVLLSIVDRRLSGSSDAVELRQLQDLRQAIVRTWP